MKPINRIVGNAGLLLSSQFGVGLISLVQGVLVARWLGAADYGSMAIAIAYPLLIAQFFDCRVWEALTTFLPKFQELGEHEAAGSTLKLCIWIELITGILATVVVLITADWGARWIFRDTTVGPLIRLASGLVLLRIPHETAKALLRLTNRFGWLVKQAAFTAALQLLLVVAACSFGLTVEWLLLIQLFATMVGSIILIVMGCKAACRMPLHNPLRARWSSLRDHWRELSQFLLLANLSATSRLANKLDVILLGWLGTMSDVGIYQVARKATHVLALPAASLRQTIFPELSKLAAGGKHDELHRLPRELTWMISISVLPVCLAATLVAPWAVPGIWGPEFAPATLLVQILVWNSLGLSLTWFQPYLLSTGRARTMLAVQMAVTILNTGTLLVLTQSWGVIGTAAARAARPPIKAVLIWFTLVDSWPVGHGISGPQPTRSERLQ